MPLDSIIYASVVIGAVGVIFGALISSYKLFKKFDEVIGKDREGRSIADRLDRVEHQLWENGGSSLADRVNNIEMHVVKVSAEVELIKDITLGLHSTMTGPVATPQRKSSRKAS